MGEGDDLGELDLVACQGARWHKSRGLWVLKEGSIYVERKVVSVGARPMGRPAMRARTEPALGRARLPRRGHTRRSGRAAGPDLLCPPNLAVSRCQKENLTLSRRIGANLRQRQQVACRHAFIEGTSIESGASLYASRSPGRSTFQRLIAGRSGLRPPKHTKPNTNVITVEGSGTLPTTAVANGIVPPRATLGNPGSENTSVGTTDSPGLQ